MVRYAGERQAREWQADDGEGAFIEADYTDAWIYFGDEVAAGQVTVKSERGHRRTIWIYSGGEMLETDLDLSDSGRHVANTIRWTNRKDRIRNRLITQLSDPVLNGPLMLRAAVPEGSEMTLASLARKTPADVSIKIFFSKELAKHVKRFKVQQRSTDGDKWKWLKVNQNVEYIFDLDSTGGETLPNRLESQYHYRKFTGSHTVGINWLISFNLLEVHEANDAEVRNRLLSQFQDGAQIVTWENVDLSDGLTREWRDGKVNIIYDQAHVARLNATVPAAAEADNSSWPAIIAVCAVCAAIGGGFIVLVLWLRKAPQDAAG